MEYNINTIFIDLSKLTVIERDFKIVSYKTKKNVHFYYCLNLFYYSSKNSSKYIRLMIKWLRN